MDSGGNNSLRNHVPIIFWCGAILALYLPIFLGISLFGVLSQIEEILLQKFWVEVREQKQGWAEGRNRHTQMQ